MATQANTTGIFEISMRANGKVKTYNPTGMGYMLRKASEKGFRYAHILQSQDKYNGQCVLVVKYANDDVHVSVWASRANCRAWLKRKGIFKYSYIPLLLQ